MTDAIEISVGFATIGQGAGPLMVTWKSGLFGKYGLAVNRPRLMGGANGVVRGLMSGEIQFGNMAAPAPLRANLKAGADLIFLTGGINQQFVMGRPGITAREQLGGKHIGFVGDGGLNDALVRFIIRELRQAGIDVRAQPIPSGGARQIETLLAGRCDALVVTPPDCIHARRAGCSYLIDFAVYGFNYALGGIAARQDYIGKNNAVAERFVKAYVEGMRRYRDDREFAIAVQAEYSGITDRGIAAETYDLTRPGMPAVPYPVVSALQALLHGMAEDLPEARVADARRFVDDRFVAAIEKTGLNDFPG